MQTSNVNIYTASSNNVYDTKLTDNTDAISSASPSIHSASSIEQESDVDLYEKTVDENIIKILEGYGLEPQNTFAKWNSKFERKYKEGDFECKKYKNFDGTYTIIKKASQDLGTIFLDTLCGQSQEIIVETYDSKNVMTKTTHYEKDGTYSVKKYENGNLSYEVSTKNTNPASWNDYTYSSMAVLKDYNNDKSYAMTNIKCSMNYENEDGIPSFDQSTTYYDKNGKVDWGKQLAPVVTVFAGAIISGIINSDKNC